MSLSKKIHSLRKKIDQVDKQIIEKLAERLRLARKIGIEKKKANLKIRDNRREKQSRHLHETNAKKLGLNKKFIEQVFKKITDEARRVQR